MILGTYDLIHIVLLSYMETSLLASPSLKQFLPVPLFEQFQIARKLHKGSNQ